MTEVNENNQSAPEKKMTNKQKVRLVLTTILTIALVTFVFQNANRVEVDFLNFTVRVRIVYIILISAVFGGLLTFLLMMQRKRRK